MAIDHVYYQYQPLKPNHIRILQIQYPTRRSRLYLIELKVKEVDLTSNPKFNALSYTWGPPNLLLNKEPPIFTTEPRCFPLVCDGKLVRGTENLRDALWKLRSAALGRSAEILQEKMAVDVTLPIWIDALCINQDDVQERNSQVVLMADIYRSAQSVLAWLGDADEHSRVAMPMTEKIARYGAGKHVSSATDNLEKQDKDSTVLWNMFDHQEWISFSLFFKRHWFERTWILQEASMNANVILMCGTGCAVWGDVSAAARTLVEYQLPTGLHAMLMDYAYEHPEYRDLLPTQTFKPASLSNFSRIALTYGLGASVREGEQDGFYFAHQLALNTDCSDPRDKIYALLGFCSDLTQGPTKIRPDYTVDVSKLYVQAWYLTISKEASLRPLHTFQNPDRIPKHSGLPSWCPDFTKIIGQFNFYAPGDPCSWQADKSLSSSPSTISLDNTLLQVAGVYLSNIVEVTKVESYISSRPLKCAEVVAFASRVQGTKQNYSCAKQSPFEMLWRTLIADTLTTYGTADSQIGKAMVKLFSGFSESFRKNTSQNPIKINIKDLEEISTLFETMQRECRFENSQIPDLVLFHALLNAHQSVTRKSDTYILTPEFTNSDAIDQALQVTKADKLNIQAWHTKTLKLIGGRHLFRTDDGCLGYSADCTRAGDQVWVLHGLDTPCVLRALPNGRFQFMGDAYVHGIMNGEAVSEELGVVRVELE